MKSSNTPQHKRILEWLNDGDWHCATQMEYMFDLRKRLQELRDKGYNIEGERCKLNHDHSSGVFMRRWVKVKPRTMIIYDPIKGIAKEV